MKTATASGSTFGMKTWTVIGAIAIGLTLGMLLRPPVDAEAQTRGGPKQFRSGAERSEIVLRQIADTLERMDRRLARIEQAATEARAASRLPPARP